jgi:hypothetical protein
MHFVFNDEECTQQDRTDDDEDVSVWRPMCYGAIDKS